MALTDLSAGDQATIRRCLEYILRSDALEGEFHTRMGVDEWDVQQLLDRWPDMEGANADSLV